MRRIFKIYLHYRRMFKIFKGFNTPSYYGISSKSAFTKIIDYLYIFFILKIMPNNYHLFGFDFKNRSKFKEYLGDTLEPVYYNQLRCKLWSHNILVHDKFVFKCLCQQNGLPVPNNFGLIKDNKINGNGTNLGELMASHGLNRVIVKPVLGGGGKGIHLISMNDCLPISELEKIDACAGNYMKDGYLVEELLEQHEEMNKINPYTLNSIRIITILCSDGTAEILAAMLKTSSTNMPMDNFSQGGIVIGIDVCTGKLKSYGVMQYPQGKILHEHPLTKTKFSDFQIPFWQEVKETTEKAQKVFHQVKSVGWDIAVTPKGPVIIEGNQDWGTNGIQAANGGLLTTRNKVLFAQYGIKFYE